MPKHKKKYHVKTGRKLQNYWEQRRRKHGGDDENSKTILSVTSVNPFQDLDDSENSSVPAAAEVLKKNAHLNENNYQEIEVLVDRPDTPELLVEQEVPEIYVKEPSGRRIVDIKYFFEEIKKISRHGCLGCDIQCLQLVGEKQTGFRSKFKFKCGMCNMVFFVENDCNDCDINNCAVAGTIAIGCGYSQLQELASALDLPLISSTVFRTRQELVAKKWEEIAYENMNKAGEEEKAFAIAEGKVNKNGIPIIDVIADGCYSKRSYKTNYSSLSGAAAIVGRKTGKILYLGIKNKYCSICTQAERKKVREKKRKIKHC